MENQTYPIHKIIIVDNHSTDNTADYLQRFQNNPHYKIIRTTENTGGAGGFSLGLKKSVEEGCDYSWLMDDDTLPSATALEELIRTANRQPDAGFLCSHVNWTDGTTHVSNEIKNFWKEANISPELEETYRCQMGTFVSMLINTQGVLKVGLPIQEFFIWYDDTEYSLRLSKAGYVGYYVRSSIVVHKTPTNYFPSIDKAPRQLAPRFYYHARNSCYIKRCQQKNKLFFFFSILNKYRLYLHRIGRRTDNDKKDFIRAVRQGCIAGLTFNPPIEYICPSTGQ